MHKILLAGVLAVCMLTSAALAEVYEGTVVAASEIQVTAASGGILETLDAEIGSIVSEGDVLGSLRTTRVFASQDGTVASIQYQEGEEADGTVMEIYPVERYQIFCTVDKAYQSAESMLVHSGEQVYIKCTANGTHRGIGLITQIEGDEYRVLAIGGELYVGETVYLYRDEDFSAKQRVGIGTVVTSDTEIYEAEGKIVRMHVKEGEYVERGELLYEISGGDTEIFAPEDGLIAAMAVQQGEHVEAEQTVLTLVPEGQFCIEIYVDETSAAQLTEGDAVEITYPSDAQERIWKGVVAEISRIAEESNYRVKILPESTEGLKLGMTAELRTKLG